MSFAQCTCEWELEAIAEAEDPLQFGEPSVLSALKIKDLDGELRGFSGETQPFIVCFEIGNSTFSAPQQREVDPVPVNRQMIAVVHDMGSPPTCMQTPNLALRRRTTACAFGCNLWSLLSPLSRRPLYRLQHGLRLSARGRSAQKRAQGPAYDGAAITSAREIRCVRLHRANRARRVVPERSKPQHNVPVNGSILEGMNNRSPR